MDDLQTLTALIDRLDTYAERTAVLAFRKEDTETWSYRQLNETAGQLASGLRRAGIEQGQQIALMAEASPPWVAVALAAIRVGAVIVPVDEQFGDEALTHVLKDSEARLLFTTGSHAKRLEEMALDDCPPVVLLDDDSGGEKSWRRYLSDEDVEFPDITEDDFVTLFYTSGTTGPPKGVPLTHKNLAFQLNAIRNVELVQSDDVVLLPLPIHHVYPFVMGLMAPISLGLPLVFPRSLTGPQIMRALREGRVTLIIGVPRLYRALYDGIETNLKQAAAPVRTVLSGLMRLSRAMREKMGINAGRVLLKPLHRKMGPHVRILASGGSALNPELARNLEGLGWSIAAGYGLTETSPLLSLNHPKNSNLESAGLPVEGLELRIDPAARADADGEGKRSASGEFTTEPEVQGEIVAKGPNVFQGYRNLPDKTADVLSEDGWFRTGDLGKFDDKGFVYVLGRVATMIVTEGGENVQPEDVEEAYEKSPLVREMGILQKDSKLVAVIVPEFSELATRDEDAIKEQLRESVNEQSRSLPSYQRLADFEITREPLPRTRLNKIRRHILEEMYDRIVSEGAGTEPRQAGPMPIERMASEDRVLLHDETVRKVWDLLVERYPEEPVAPDTNLQLDLGVDSLEWLNLTMEISDQTGIELEDEAVTGVETVRDLLHAVSEAKESAQSASLDDMLERPEEQLTAEQKRWLEPYGAGMAFLARLLYATVWIIMRVVFPVRAKGVENLDKVDYALLTPNHESYLDPFVVVMGLGYRRLQKTYWGGWTGIVFTGRLMRLFSRLSRIVPIDRDKGVHSSLAFGAAVLLREQSLVWFPEGERTWKGELQEFKPGIGLLLNKHPVKVIPVFIEGAHEALPRGKFWPRPRRIEVTFGEPVTPDELVKAAEAATPGDDERKRFEKIAAGLQRKVAELGDGE